MSPCWCLNLSAFKVVVDDWFNICRQTIFLYDNNAYGFFIHITCYIIINIKIGTIQCCCSNGNQSASTLGSKHSIV